MNLSKHPRRSALLLVAICILLSGVIYFFGGSNDKAPEIIVRNAGQKVDELRGEMQKSLDDFSAGKQKVSWQSLIRKTDSPGFSYYLLKDGKLIAWSDNEPAVDENVFSGIHNNTFVSLPNGDFLAFTSSKNDTVLAGLILIRHSYHYQNKYLRNEFNKSLGLDNFTPSSTGYTFSIPGTAKKYILGELQNPIQESRPEIIIFILLIASLLSIAVFLLLRDAGRSTLSHIIMIAVLFLLRTAMIYFKWPYVLYSLDVFNPSFYASSFYFNSLGDMFINAVLMLIITISIYEHARPYRRFRLLLFFYWAVTAFVVHWLIRGLVINSRLNFELSSPADISIYSFIGFASISLLLLSFLFVTISVWRNMQSYFVNGRHAWIGITACALYSAIALTQLNNIKEHRTRELLAQKAEARQDHVAEYLFAEQEPKIENDTAIMRMLHSPKISGELTAYLIPQYFSGYLSKFEVAVQLFDEYETADTNVNLNFYRQLAQKGKPTENNKLFFINSDNGGAFYLALIPLNEKASVTGIDHTHTLVIMLTPRLFRTAKGFPELLMSGTSQEVTPADDYSIARYSSRSLVYQYGDYVYPLTSGDFDPAKDGEYIEAGGYSHFVHFIDANTFIVVSRPASSLLGILTLFSWMFIFMSVAAFVIFILAGLITGTNAFRWNLTRKVQGSVIFLIVVIFVLIGTGTVYYIKSKYLSDQNKSISDQVNALWFLINDNVLMNAPVNVTDDQSEQLNRLVSNTNIDFNLYNSEGLIVYSSQPKIYKAGIVSGRMNPVAYFKIHEGGLTQFIHPEKAGQLRYIAAYAPFTDRKGNITAFLNLPYFEKQNELNKEVSVFLSAIVNIYVLLFAVAVFVTIFISSQITKPLLLIQEKLSGLRLGSTNEKIEYSSNDEIGQLVHEYNRMIDELALSAEKLARSERESAWREMARQVAHEIKNPLTPMKLSVQHLQRTLKEGADNSMVDRLTDTLIIQIDALSNIATAFSNFANMPQPVPKHVDVKEILSQVVDLYDEEGNIQLVADENNYPVVADREQLFGVFSNLIKNSLQSVPDERRAEVGVYIRREQGYITVRITDNGIGIPEDQKDKIFIPNFTTKSSGMGLGLAIARNIVEEAGGKIWFSSIYGQGSSFFVSLPAQE